MAASLHRGNRLSGPSGSVIILCLTTSLGYDAIQNTCADSPPAQKLTAGVDRFVCFCNARVKTSYEPHQKQKNVRNSSVAESPW